MNGLTLLLTAVNDSMGVVASAVEPHVEESLQRTVAVTFPEIVVVGKVGLVVHDHIDRDGKMHEEIHQPQRDDFHHPYQGTVHPGRSVRSALPFPAFLGHPTRS